MGPVSAEAARSACAALRSYLAAGCLGGGFELALAVEDVCRFVEASVIDAPTLTMIVHCRRQAPPLPLLAVGVEVSGGGHDGEGEPTFLAAPGPHAAEIMFRHANPQENPSGGFKLYGIGTWPGIPGGGEDSETGRAEAFAVSPRTAAWVLNGLLRLGWALVTCPPEYADVHLRVWDPRDAEDIRPISPAGIGEACGVSKAA